MLCIMQGLPFLRWPNEMDASQSPAVALTSSMRSIQAARQHHLIVSFLASMSARGQSGQQSMFSSAVACHWF